MASAEEEKLARLALDRGLITVKQLSEARVRQRALKEKEGVDESLGRVLLSAGFISDDDIRWIILAVEAGEGEERGSSGGAAVVGSEDEGTESEGGRPTLKLPAQRPPDEPPKDPSRVIGGYEIIEQIGAAAVGDVYKARKPGSEKLYAVKVLSPSKASADFVARFKREIEVACRLNHANVVGCVEFGYDPARASHFYVMDFVEGEDLKARVERAGPLGEHEALVTARQVGMALRHAYENGLVHRDVKPDNIMLMSSGHVKLLDLGLARPVTRGASDLTVAGSFAGSPAYSSPEQARGESTVDIRSDIYSLGATLYYAVTGEQPFAGGTVGDVLAGHMTGHIPWPADVNPGLSRGTCLIIAKAMARDPAERYRTPVELTLDLEIILQGIEPVIAKKAPADSTVGPPSGESRRPKSGAPTPRRARPPSAARMAEQPGGGRAASGPSDVARHRGPRARPVSRPARPESRPAPGARPRSSEPEAGADLEDEDRGRSPIVYLLVPLLLGALVVVVALSVTSTPDEDARGGREPPPPETVLSGGDAPAPAEVQSAVDAPAPAELQTAAEAPAAIGPPGWLPVFAGHAYMLFRVPLSWPDAKTFCEARGGHLVTIGSQEEQDFASSIMGDAPRAWIGLSDGREEGVFEWVTGEPVDYTAWRPGEPNDAGDGEDLGEILAGGWNDSRSSARPAFICEWERPEAAARLGGLAAEYFADLELKQSVLKRVDVVMDCRWGAGSPAPDVVPADNFAVRWDGFVLPPASGEYVFMTVSDDNARLWIDGELVIDDWPEPHGPKEVRSAPIRLEAGEPRRLRLEFREFGGSALIRLLWEGPGVERQVVPPESLRPPGDGPGGNPF